MDPSQQPSTVAQLIGRAEYALENASHTDDPTERAYYLDRARVCASLAQARATADLAEATGRR